MNTGRWNASRVHEYCVPSVRVPGPCVLTQKHCRAVCVLLVDRCAATLGAPSDAAVHFVRDPRHRIASVTAEPPPSFTLLMRRCSAMQCSLRQQHSSVVPRWRRHLVNVFLVFHTLSMIVYYPYFFLTADVISLFLQRYFSAFYFICILIRIYLPAWL